MNNDQNEISLSDYEMISPESDFGYTTDGELGFSIHNHLKSKGLESPLNPEFFHRRTKEERIETMEGAAKILLSSIGMNLSSPDVNKTPLRIARMFLEIFKGLDYRNFPSITTFNSPEELMVRWDDITVSSYCEHHLQSITGSCKVAYIPKGKMFGLSKVNRIVDFFSSRPCTQERLTSQIHETIQFLLDGNQDVAVQITARHGCVSCRGIKDAGSQVTTTKIGGSFKKHDSTRLEFFNS